MKFSIVIPTWNKANLLEKNLPSVLSCGADEVIVVDNGSNDNTLNYLNQLKKKNSSLKIIRLDKNYVFIYPCNLGIKKSTGEIVILLNNDVIPEKSFLKPLTEDFADKKVFAVSFHEPQWSWAKGAWVKGFVDHGPGNKTQSVHPSFWASGGSAAFRKDIWLSLGGFDFLYYPFYWEDVDICYRAWKRGFKIIWDPRSIVHHRHEGTVGTHFTKDYVGLISQRNQLLFIWKNITNYKMMIEHEFWLTKRLLTNPGYWKPFLMALIKLPQIFPRRLAEISQAKVADKAIFDLFK